MDPSEGSTAGVAGGEGARVVPHAAPAWFEGHRFETGFEVRVSAARAWAWLNTPETFTRGQPPMYRVEFVDPAGGAGDFRVGVLTNHMGPWLNAAGMITRIEDGGVGVGASGAVSAWREIEYCYGAFVISPKLIRPTRLTVRVTPTSRSDTAAITIVLESLVHRRWAWLATAGQRLFWAGFRWTARRELERGRGLARGSAGGAA